MNVRALLDQTQRSYLRTKDPALLVVPDERLAEILEARLGIGAAPLSLVDCQAPLDFGELAGAIRFFVANSDLGCPRKEMAALAAASFLDETAKTWGAHPSQRVTPPAERCRGCPGR